MSVSCKRSNGFGWYFTLFRVEQRMAAGYNQETYAIKVRWNFKPNNCNEGIFFFLKFGEPTKVTK